MAVLDELLVGLGFEYDDKDLSKFNNDLNQTVSVLKTFAKTVVAGTAALVGFTAASTAATDKQGKLASQTGMAVEDIDAYGFALQIAGGDADTMSNNLEQLAIRISETSRGLGSGVEAFGLLGISVTDANGNLKDTSRIMLEVADRMQGMDKVKQIELADKLGLRDSILLLQEGSDGINTLLQEARALGVTTAKDAAIAAEFQDAWSDTFQIIKQFSRTVTRSLAPAMTDLANKFKEWWKRNRDVIEQNIPKFIDGLTKAFKLLTLAVGVFAASKIVSLLFTIGKGFKLATLAALATQAAIFAIPTAIAALVAGIALLMDDARGFFEGADSVIGRLIKRFPEWKEELTSVAAVFATMSDLLGMAMKGWGMIFDIAVEGVNKFIENWKAFVAIFTSDDPSEAFKSLVFKILMSWAGVMDDIRIIWRQAWKDISTAASDFMSGLWNGITKLAEQTWDGISSFIVDKVSSVVEGVKKLFRSLWASAKKSATDTWEGILAAISNFTIDVFSVFNFDGVVDGFMKLWEDVKKSLSEIKLSDLINFDNPFKDIGGKLSTGIFDVKEGIGRLSDEVSADLSGLKNSIMGLFTDSAKPTIFPIASALSSNVGRDFMPVAGETKNSSNSNKIELGGINVTVAGNSNDPKTLGKETAKSLARELEPILKQASIDLNNAVAL